LPIVHPAVGAVAGLSESHTMTLSIRKLAAFSDGAHGGNPAGVWTGAAFPDDAAMQAIATELRYSETVFAAATDKGWRVRYFSPASEVPFCGHATIALGATLALEHGDGVFPLTLHMSGANITVDGAKSGELFSAALQSPKTSSRQLASSPVDKHSIIYRDALALFGLTPEDLDPRIPAALAHGGADHVILALRSRQKLSEMAYDLAAGRDFMRAAGLATIALVHAETPQLFHARNPFASGNVYEDPATGAAAAALAGYLRDIGWPHGGAIDIVQGEDMGCICRIHADISATPGDSIRVSGTARLLAD
jgi:PhzF family phenazine biosynthesis protein